ncbi:hypothetical protein MKX08_006837 [Trichoderma sp. CBMAI-0020]|nr:hypothetical protein MKX08_006837 [Trichoderma sp. CBMAI-0020]
MAKLNSLTTGVKTPFSTIRLPSGIEFEYDAGVSATNMDSMFHLTRYANVIVKISSATPMLDDETALGSDIIMSKTRHFAAGLENLAH